MAVLPWQPVATAVVAMMAAAAVVCLFLVRSAHTRRRQQTELQLSLRIGDEVITSGGVYGLVVEVANRVLTLEVASGVRIKMLAEHVAARWPR